MKKIKAAIKNIIYNLFPKVNGLNVVRVLAGPAKRTKMMLDLRIGGSYFIGNYDKWIFDRVPLKDILKPGMVAWDCGAFYGYYGAIFRNLVGKTGNVEIFEASSTNFNVVTNLPQLNKWDNVRVHNLAVGPDHSSIKFTTNLGGSSGPYGLSKTYNESEAELEIETVACSGVDELIEERGIAIPDLIKFDLESAEIFALKNGHNLFTTKKPIILLELHGQEALQAAAEFIEQYKYKAIIIYEMNMPNKRVFTTKEALLGIGYLPHMLYLYAN